MSHLERFSSDEIEYNLGPEGPGVLSLPNLLDNTFREQLIEELGDESKVHWQETSGHYVNGRGVSVIQNHDTFALKLSAGDQASVERVPVMQRLAEGVQSVVRSLDYIFPSLSSWQADEMSYHRYFEKDVGLSYHRDNLRFIGLIAIVAVMGEAEFRVIDRSPVSKRFDESLKRDVVAEWQVREELIINTKPGDLILTRAMNLYPGMKDSDRPEHAVMNAEVLPRVSFMLRDNVRPLDQKFGFTYYNWP